MVYEPSIIKQLKKEEKLGLLTIDDKNKNKNPEPGNVNIEKKPVEVTGKNIWDLKNFNLITEKISDFIIDISLSFNPVFTCVNPAVYKKLRYNYDELIDKPFLSFIHHDDKKRIINLLKKHLVDKKNTVIDVASPLSEKMELRLKSKDGRWHNLQCDVNLFLRDKHILIISQDVTEMRLKEEQLRKSDERFKGMAESINEGLTIIENDKIVYVNNRLVEILGYPKKELVKLTGLDIALPEEKKRLRNIIQEFKDNKRKINEVEFWVKRKNGEIRCIRNSYSVRRNGDKIIGRYVLTADITEKKEREKEVEKAKKEAETILDGAIDGIRIINLDFKVIKLNKKMSELAGLEENQGVGMRCSEMFKAENICDTDECSIKKILNNKKGYRREETRMRKDGKKIICHVAVRPYYDNKGNIIGVIEYFRDISDIKKTEEKLREKIEELERYKKITVGRELKMRELKDEIKKLKNQIQMEEKIV